MTVQLLTYFDNSCHFLCYTTIRS